jgi:hypothetical protein
MHCCNFGGTKCMAANSNAAGISKFVSANIPGGRSWQTLEGARISAQKWNGILMVDSGVRALALK